MSSDTTSSDRYKQDAISKNLAYNEHKSYRHLSIWSSLDIIQQRIGPNVRWYFTYISRVVIPDSLVMSVLGIVFLGVHLHNMASDRDESVLDLVTTEPNPFVWMSISNMSSKTLPLWYTMTIVNVLLKYLNVWYFRYLVHRVQNRTNVDSKHFDTSVMDDPTNGKLGDIGGVRALDVITTGVTKTLARNHDGSDISSTINIDPPVYESKALSLPIILPPPRGYAVGVPWGDMMVNPEQVLAQLKSTRIQRVKRYFASTVLFSTLLGSQIVANYYAYVSNNGFHNEAIISILLSAGLTVANIIWQLLAHYSTTLEGHQHQTDFQKSYFIKTYIFRMTSTVILFSFSQLRLFKPNSVSEALGIAGNDNIINCPFDLLAQQYCIILALEVLASSISSLGITAIHRKIVEKSCRKANDSENVFYPIFSLPEEYADILYKQFLCLLGVPVFPVMGVLMVGVFYCEWLFDRTKLIYYCKPIIRTNNTFKTLILYMNTLNIAIAIFVPPNGILWIILGYHNHCLTSVFG